MLVLPTGQKAVLRGSHQGATRSGKDDLEKGSAAAIIVWKQGSKYWVSQPLAPPLDFGSHAVLALQRMNASVLFQTPSVWRRTR